MIVMTFSVMKDLVFQSFIKQKTSVHSNVGLSQ